MFGSRALFLVPQALRRYSTLYPDVRVVLLNVTQPAQVEALRQPQILITFDRYLLEDQDLMVEMVVRERRFVALQKRNPLATRALVRWRRFLRSASLSAGTRATRNPSPRCVKRTASIRVWARRQAIW